MQKYSCELPTQICVRLSCVGVQTKYSRTRNAGDFHAALRKAHLEFEPGICEVKEQT